MAEQRRRNQWDSTDASGHDWNSGEDFDPVPNAAAQPAQTPQQAAPAATPPQPVPQAAQPVPQTQAVVPQAVPGATDGLRSLAAQPQAPIAYVDTSGVRRYLEQERDASAERASGQIDRAVTRGVNELQRTREDAEEQYRTQQNQIALDEKRGLDNRALYDAMRGDRGGIGAEQYNSIMNAAATNRAAVNNAQTKMRTEISRQMAELRANGEFQKSDALLQAAQQFMSQMAQLEQWALSTNATIDQFNAQMEQTQREYNLRLAELGLQQYQWEQSFAYQKERDRADDAYRDKVYDRNVYESDRNYNRSVLESDRAYDRNVLESDRSYEFQIQAYKDQLEQQARENGWRQQEIDLQLRAYEDGLKQQKLENERIERQMAEQQRIQLANDGLTRINNGYTPTPEQLKALDMSYEEASTRASIARAREALGLEQLQLGIESAELGNESTRLNNEAAKTTLDAMKSANAGGSSSFGDATSRLFADAQASGNPQSYITNNYKKYGLASSSGLYQDYKNWLSGGAGGGMTYEDALAEAQAGRWSDAIYEGLRQRLSPADIQRYFGKDRDEYSSSDYNDYIQNGYLDKIRSLPRSTIGDNANPMSQSMYAGYRNAISKTLNASGVDAAQEKVNQIWDKLGYDQRIDLLVHLYGLGMEANF